MTYDIAADGTIKIWNVQTGAHEHTFEGHLSGISILAWSPDSRWVASGGDDKLIRLWDVSTVRIPKISSLQIVCWEY